MENLQTYDAVILGAGPAGINCALELHESKVNYLLIDRSPQLGGQLGDLKNSIRNFAARFWKSGAHLREDMESLCDHIGIVTQLSETIREIDLPTKVLFGSTNNYKSKAIFLATGTRPRLLKIEGTETVKENIILYVEENEARIAGKSIVVVGGGDNALMDSLWLAQRCPNVLLVHRSSHFKARPDVVAEVMENHRIKVLQNSEIKSVTGSQGQLQNVTVKNTISGKATTYDADFLVMRVGFAPNSEPFAGQVKTDMAGLVIVDQSCQTNIDGIFAGGDLVAPECPGIARSAGHGLIAARAICRYLLTQT